MTQRQFRYKTVLLVDDSYLDNLISRKILENIRFAENIIVIDSPRRAVDFLQKSIEENENIPEVIFLDIRMPEMNGFDFLSKIDFIKEISGEKIKIYMLSSSLDPSDMKRVAESQLVSKFIGKPLTEKTLTEI